MEMILKDGRTLAYAEYQSAPRGLEICQESVQAAFRQGVRGHAWRTFTSQFMFGMVKQIGMLPSTWDVTWQA